MRWVSQPCSRARVRTPSSELEDLAFELRSKLLHLCGTYEGAVHIGGDLSAADIFTALFEYGLHVDPTDLRNPERDRFVLSKGHAAVCMYIAMSIRGFFSYEGIVDTYGQLDSAYGMHPCKVQLPGVECSTGSLGHGLPLAVGMALSARGRGESHRVVCLLGDGETGEGSVWEAAMAARSNELGNLVAFVDRNRQLMTSFAEERVVFEPYPDKWAAFGWNVVHIDGHDMGQLVGGDRRTAGDRQRPPDRRHLRNRQGQGRRLHGAQPRLARRLARRRRPGARDGRARRHRVRRSPSDARHLHLRRDALRPFRHRDDARRTRRRLPEPLGAHPRHRGDARRVPRQVPRAVPRCGACRAGLRRDRRRTGVRRQHPRRLGDAALPQHAGARAGALGRLLPEPAREDHRHARRARRQRRLDPLRGRGPRAHVRADEHDGHLDRRPAHGRRDPPPVHDDGGADLHPPRRGQEGQGALRARAARDPHRQGHHRPPGHGLPRSSRTAPSSRRRWMPRTNSRKKASRCASWTCSRSSRSTRT